MLALKTVHIRVVEDGEFGEQEVENWILDGPPPASAESELYGGNA